MIRSVTVTNYLGEKAKIVLKDEEPTHGFLISSIDGLGPTKANINTSELSLYDGSLYNSARLEPRNIVIKMIFSPAPTIEEARLNTYKYFPIKKKVLLEFETDKRNAKIEGYVESNDPDIFSEQESNSISIICPDPYFYRNSDELESTSFVTVIPLFEFPYENECEDGVTPNTEFGSIIMNEVKTIVYNGDMDVGMTITINATGETGNIRITNYTSGEDLYISDNAVESITGSPISAGDRIVITTERGKKTCRLYRYGVSYNILNCLGRNPSWLRLQKGENQLRYNCSTGSIYANVKIENEVIYEGI